MDTGALHEASLFFIIILMFLGASPGSTGGGIKTTTFAIILRQLPLSFVAMKKLHCLKDVLNMI